MCRRAGVSLCGRKNCASNKRPFAPGAHGNKRRARLTPYGIQLREKQMAKHLYGVQERQFRKYFESASRRKGDTAQMLVRMLELRLDNVVFRMGLATNRFQARQLVSHGHLMVNGKPVNIPSFAVRVGEVVAIREKSKKMKMFNERAEEMKQMQLPAWVTLNVDELSGKVVAEPEGEDLRQIFDSKVIVEFYSR